MICNLCGKKIHWWQQFTNEINDFCAVGERINQSRWAHGKCIDKVHLEESSQKGEKE